MTTLHEEPSSFQLLFTLEVAYSVVAAMVSEGNVSGQEDDGAGSSGDEIDSANLLLNRNGTALSAEDTEDKTASTSLLEHLQSLWQNKKNIAAVVMLWTSLLSTLANKSLMTSFFPQEVIMGKIQGLLRGLSAETLGVTYSTNQK